MTITKCLGIYVLLDRKHGFYFTGQTRASVIEKAIYQLFLINK